jgi:mono/diheme cytochrome c family protein
MKLKKDKLRCYGLALASVLMIAACGSDDDKPQERALVIAGSPGSAESGAVLFARHCAVCHGAQGQGFAGPDLRVDALTRDRIIEIVLRGRGSMPSFADRLSDQDIADIAAHIESF